MRRPGQRRAVSELQLGKHGIQGLFLWIALCVKVFLLSCAPSYSTLQGEPRWQRRGSPRVDATQLCVDITVPSLWENCSLSRTLPHQLLSASCIPMNGLCDRFPGRPRELLFSCRLGGRKESVSAEDLKENPQEAETPPFPFSQQSSWFASIPSLPVSPGT